ncbi:MAG: cobalamin biosynthesis protein [Anaerotruncus massiliensis (ex Togo et al. 2019)]
MRARFPLGWRTAPPRWELRHARRGKGALSAHPARLSARRDGRGRLGAFRGNVRTGNLGAGDARIPLAAIRQLATIDRKAEEPCILAFCERYGLPLAAASARRFPPSREFTPSSSCAGRWCG